MRQEFYSAANQAILQSELKNGPKEYWAGCHSLEITVSLLDSCEEWYNIYLKDFLNTVKVEHFTSGGLENIAAYFADGSLLVIKDGYDMYFYPFAKGFDKDKFYTQSDDGYSRPDCGTKYFAFAFIPAAMNQQSSYYKGKGIEPYKSIYCTWETQSDGEKELICNSLTRDELINQPDYGCNENSRYKVYCTALIQENNWEIPDDYPLKL